MDEENQIIAPNSESTEKLNKSNEPQLVFYNSLTKTTEVFNPDSIPLKWYTCGPTVYDSPHIGHARTYICFDVLRNVLAKYFGYEIVYVMNVTDVDDKIINKAKEIIDSRFKSEIVKLNDNEINGLTIIGDESYRNLFQDICKEITAKYEDEFFSALESLKVKSPTFVTRVTEFIQEIIIFIEKLMEKGLAYKMNGSVYFDVGVYKRKCKYPVFVDQKHIRDEDEEENNIKTDDNIEKNTNNKNETNIVQNSDNTVENINIENNTSNIKCVKINNNKNETNILHNNDINLKFGEIDNNAENKDNINTNNKKLFDNFENVKIDEKTNSIDIKNLEVNKKKNIADFVLWKHRTTDLFFESSLGPGRPGWHIECSTMVHNIFPEGLHIHSGGIDLAFPHHENEMAQSQALMHNLWKEYKNTDSIKTNNGYDQNKITPEGYRKWSSFFLHTGHLHIDGHKMSKSLKNFITIKEMLESYTARQIRICMIMHKWWLQMTYSKDLMKQAIQVENKIFNFLSVIDAEIKNKEKNNTSKVEINKVYENKHEIKNMNNNNMNHKIDNENINSSKNNNMKDNIKNSNGENAKNKNKHESNIIVEKNLKNSQKMILKNEDSCKIIDKKCDNDINAKNQAFTRNDYINNVIFDQDDQEYYKILTSAENEIHRALCNNIDTSTAMKNILDLISTTNTNMKLIGLHVLVEIRKYIKRILNIFGITDDESFKNDKNEDTDFLIETISSFRNKIRDLCKKKSSINEFYKASDKIRDILNEKGFVIDDNGKDSRIRKKL